MTKVLVPVDASRASRAAVKQAIAEFKTAGPTEIHVLAVPPPLRRHVSQFIDRPVRASFYRDEAERALRPARQMLDEAGVPYAAHAKVGPRATVIAATASRLGCDYILIGTTRPGPLGCIVDSAAVDGVLERTRVPVLIVVGGEPSKAERYAVPAGIGAALAVLLYAAAD